MSAELIKFKFIKALSYLPLLFLVAFGFAFMMFQGFPNRVFSSAPISIGLGVIAFLIGTVLVLWSEKVRHRLFSKRDGLVCDDFAEGIYKYSRHPGTLGFLILFFGFGFFLNSMAFIMVGLAHFILLSFVFIPLVEHQIIKVCGDSYQEYRANVRMWL